LAVNRSASSQSGGSDQISGNRSGSLEAAFPHPHKTAEDGNTRLPS
jgi:hypothetical protein